jgi:branched-chain amino acid transport system substrate-binding protein
VRRIHQLAAALALGGLVQASASSAADELTVGMITTLSGPGAGLGIDIRDGFALGLEHLGGKLGGQETVVVEADDQLKPDVAVQEAAELVEREQVDLVTGTVFSNVALAIMPTLARAETFLVSPNAGPSALAGKQCNPWFFNTAWQNDNNHEATGAWVRQQGLENVYLLAPNYPAGKDALAGFKRYYKGVVAGEVYTSLDQLDFAAELANLRAAEPDAVYFFYPGGLGISFIKQYAQAGLGGTIPLFGPAFSLSQDVLAAVGDAALGAYNGSQWSNDLDNPINRRFVSGFKARYGRLPSLYASQGYDTALILDAALKGGDGLADKDAFRDSLRKVSIETSRGGFRFNSNHFPIQDYYVRQVVKLDDGTLTNRLFGKVFDDHADAYAAECGMK